MLHCPKCGASVDSGSVYCQNWMPQGQESDTRWKMSEV